MPISPEHFATALDVRRGLKRIADVNEEDRPAVVGILRKATEAQFAVMAASQERSRLSGRASRMIPRRGR